MATWNGTPALSVFPMNYHQLERVLAAVRGPRSNSGRGAYRRGVTDSPLLRSAAHASCAAAEVLYQFARVERRPPGWPNDRHALWETCRRQGAHQDAMDYEVCRCSRKCAATGRELAAGEMYYSVLTIEAGELVRTDYSEQAWQGPPGDDIVAWWRAQIPHQDAKTQKLAPSQVLLDLFQELASDPQQADVRYVLTLLLVRKRIFRLEHTERDEEHETLEVFCPRLDERFRVVVKTPTPERVQEIQDMLQSLLFAEAT